MVQMSIGDLSSSFWNQVNSRRLKASMENLSQEISTGKVTDLHMATGGDFKNLSSLESALTSLQAYKTSTAEAALFAETMQRSLANIQETTSEISSALFLAASSDSENIVKVTASDARSRFSSIISVLNSQIGNRSMFSGTETSSNPLISADEIIANIKVAIAAETTASGVEAVVSSWFGDSGGGFETIAYQGSENFLPAFRLGPNDTTSLEIRADSQGVRDLLKGFTLAALVADGTLSGSHSERLEMTRFAANHLLNSEDSITELRAHVGSIEARIESAHVRNTAEVSALELARSSILSSDPYNSATNLQTVQTQLEFLYAITAKISKLNLVNYI